MMKQMMAQMGGGKPGGQTAPSMQNMMAMCMGMCTEMLATIQHTTAMATFAAPELRAMFSDWLESREAEALAVLKEHGELDAAQLADTLNISTDGALYLLIQMARQNTVNIRAQVAKPT